MARLRGLRPDEMTTEQHQLYTEITSGPRAQGPQAFPLVDQDGALVGPFGIMLRAPQLGAALQTVGAAVRYGSSLPARTRELAILLVAAAWDSRFERYAHEAVARNMGISEQDLVAVRGGQRPPSDDSDEAVALEAVEALLDRRDLDDSEYQRLVEAVGEAGAFELTCLVGYYSMLALQLRVFRIGAPT